MADHWQSLVANLAVVALFISAWVHVGQPLAARWPRIWRSVSFGIVMGLGAVCSILLAIPLEGAFFDLRFSLVALAGFFGWWPAAIIAAAITLVFRMSLGGQVMTAAIGICAAGTTGVLVSMFTRRRRVPLIGRALILALAVGVVSLGLSYILRLSIGSTVSPLSFPVAVTNMLATLLCALFILRNREVVRERDLFRAAFIEAPDFQYVKNNEARFAAVNTRVAAFNGFASPSEMIGLTDFEITSTDRAMQLMLAEQKVLESGEPLLDQEELLVGPDGKASWYLTSKVALHNPDGDVIGLAGVTRDITADKHLKQEVVESRNKLDYVLSEITDGIAMFDKNGVLVYCNEQYREFFRLTAEQRHPGATIRQILRAVAETQEQKGAPAHDYEKWVEEIADTLRFANEQEVQLHDERWLHIRTRPTSEGAALVVVSEVTKIKQAESALLSLTEQLRLLATTDGMTGLTNRRAFDQALESEMSRTKRAGLPLSLLLIDVDRFKAYNDIYGHQAGDEALKTVATCLREALKRPGDIAARYGGEEFVAILPNTDEDGAFFIADAFRENLRALGLPHTGSEKSVLTVSVGIAVIDERDAGMNATELVRRADEALYNAKGAGRDRVTGWRARSEIRPVGLRA